MISIITVNLYSILHPFIMCESLESSYSARQSETMHTFVQPSSLSAYFMIFCLYSYNNIKAGKCITNIVDFIEIINVNMMTHLINLALSRIHVVYCRSYIIKHVMINWGRKHFEYNLNFERRKTKAESIKSEIALYSTDSVSTSMTTEPRVHSTLCKSCEQIGSIFFSYARGQAYRDAYIRMPIAIPTQLRSVVVYNQE